MVLDQDIKEAFAGFRVVRFREVETNGLLATPGLQYSEGQLPGAVIIGREHPRNREVVHHLGIGLPGGERFGRVLVDREPFFKDPATLFCPA
jgi:hypothetical protein